LFVVYLRTTLSVLPTTGHPMAYTYSNEIGTDSLRSRVGFHTQ